MSSCSIPGPVLKEQHSPYLLLSPAGMEGVYQFINLTRIKHFVVCKDAAPLETQELNIEGSLPQRHRESRWPQWSETG